MGGDGDGKVTQQEMEDKLKSMMLQMEQRMAAGGRPVGYGGLNARPGPSTGSDAQNSNSSETLQAQLIETLVRLAQSYGSIGAMGSGTNGEGDGLLNAMA